MTNAPNIDAIKHAVLDTTWMTFLGDIGDNTHQAGSGDHTTRSTHIGKYGYPTQGVVHAIDTGMTETNLDLAETFIRRSWRRGELSGIKYFNVLNRHWNIQTWANWESAKAGTLQPRYSGDHHLHLSMENGTVDGDILDRFKHWLDNRQSFRPLQEEDDDMGAYLGPFEVPVGRHWGGPINPVEAGDANPRPGWLNIGTDSYGTEYNVRVFYSDGRGSFAQMNTFHYEDGNGNDQTVTGKDGVFTFKSGIRYFTQLAKGTSLLHVSRNDDYTGPVRFGIEYGALIR